LWLDYLLAALINKWQFVRFQPHRVGWELQPPGWDAHQVVSVGSATSSHPRFRPKTVVGAYCVYAYALYGAVLLFTDFLILYEIGCWAMKNQSWRGFQRDLRRQVREQAPEFTSKTVSRKQN
jgi:hypothetical protein